MVGPSRGRGHNHGVFGVSVSAQGETPDIFNALAVSGDRLSLRPAKGQLASVSRVGKIEIFTAIKTVRAPGQSESSVPRTSKAAAES